MDLACQPLACPSCGGMVPLGDEASSRCPYCQADVPLPPEHVALREATRALAAERAAARDWYRRLVVAPRWVQTFALVEGFVFLLAVGFPIVLLVALDRGQTVLARALRAAAPALGVDVIDRFGWMTTMAAVGLVGFSLLGAPAALARYAEAFDEARKLVLRAYAARAPSTPSGPSTCRGCGAALELRRGELGARCAYCGSDNLLEIAPERVAATKGRAVEARRQLDAAIASLPAARAAGWEAVRGMLASAAGLTVAFSLLLLGVLVNGAERDGADTVPDWFDAWGPPRLVVPYHGKLSPGKQPGWPLDAPHALEITKCKDGVCSRTVYVALDAHERLTIASPTARGAELTSERNGVDPVQTKLAWVPAPSGGGQATFVQPGYCSYVVVTLRLPLAERAAAFTFSIARR